jgi:hypothetical protein
LDAFDKVMGDPLPTGQSIQTVPFEAMEEERIDPLPTELSMKPLVPAEFSSPPTVSSVSEPSQVEKPLFPVTLDQDAFVELVKQITTTVVKSHL